MIEMKRKKRGIKEKMTVAFILMGILLSLSVGIGVFIINYSQVSAQYAERAFNSAKTAVMVVNGDNIYDYLDNGKDDEYFVIYEALKELKTSFDLTYLYVATQSRTSGAAVYVFDIFSEGNDPALVEDLGDELSDADAAAFESAEQTFLTGRIEDSTVVSITTYGWLVSAYVPIYSSVGVVTAVVGADISMNRIIGEILLRSLQILLITVVVIVLFLLILRYITGRLIVYPVTDLSGHMDGFDPRDSRLDMIEVRKSGDEFQNIAQSFNHMIKDIRYYMDNLAAVTADRERIATELDIATKIQSSMLPCIFPAFPHRDEFDIYASMLPAKEVGGDFYDFFLIDDSTLAVVIADVSGKGIPAALFMVIAKTLLKNNAQSADSKSPKEVFELVNNKLCENNDTGMFVTAFMGYLDIPSGLFKFVNAGHNPPLIKKAGGEYEFLKTKPALVLAGMEDMKYTDHEISLDAGDMICLYTDGITEAVNRENELFSDPRLLEKANRYKECTAEELVVKLKDEVYLFADGAEQADDITMLVLKYQLGGDHSI